MEKLIEIARGELGYLEKSHAHLNNTDVIYDKLAGAGRDNVTKYWQDLDKSMQGQAWCLCYIVWLFVQRYGKEKAKEILCYPSASTAWTYYTPTGAQYFKQKGRWFTSPKIGDVVYFKNSERIHHVGLVITVSGNTITTIEGNTSSNSYNANGGCVAMHTYQTSDGKIAGYGRPMYPSSDGWVQSGKDWYYYRGGQKVCKEWLLDGGKWYRLGTDGKMLTGWHQIYDASGVLRWCYFGDNGALWHEADDRKGYLEEWYVE